LRQVPQGGSLCHGSLAKTENGRETGLANILVVSGESTMCEMLRSCLGEEGHLVSVRNDYSTALRLFATLDVDLICLDACDEPAMHDFWVWLLADESRCAIRVLFIVPLAGRWTAGVTPLNFRPHRDDCVAKPLDADELKRKVARLLSASPSSPSNQPRVLRSPPFTLDHETRELWADGKKTVLTPTEHRLLGYLMERSGAVVSSDELLETVWGFHPGTATAAVVRVHVSNLRRKMAALGHAQFLQALPHRGYRLVEPKGS